MKLGGFGLRMSLARIGGISLVGLVLATLLLGPTAGAVSVPGVHVASSTVGVAPVAAPAWTNMTKLVRPGAVDQAAFTYDGADQFLLLFGGSGPTAVTNNTWAFVHGNWYNLTAGPSPSARRGAAMVYDPVDRYVVLFGGAGMNNSGLGDTWTFRAGTWTLLHPVTAPSGRGGASLVWDVARGSAILFGGTANYACGCSVSGDVWSFVHGNWTRLATTAQPTLTLYTSGAAYDRATQQVIVFGGWNPRSGNTNSTYVLHLGGWTTPPTPSGLGPRQGSAMGFDPQTNQTILYGGANNRGASDRDTWTFGTSGWVKLTPTRNPPPLAWAMMAYDPGMQRLVLFGGSMNGTLEADTWVFG